MDQKNNSTKGKARVVLISAVAGLVIGAVVALLISGAFKKSEPRSTEGDTHVYNNGENGVVISQDNVVFDIKAEFLSFLFEEAQREKKLIVMTQKAEYLTKEEQEGFIPWDVFKKTKMMTFHGLGTYTVDFAKMTADDFQVNNETKTIEIHIPEPELSVEYIPEELECYETVNGWLNWGELKLTPEQMRDLEVEGKKRLYEKLANDETQVENARKFAIMSVKEMYEPIIYNQIYSQMEEEGTALTTAPHYEIVVIVDSEEKQESATN